MEEMIRESLKVPPKFSILTRNQDERRTRKRSRAFWKLWKPMPDQSGFTRRWTDSTSVKGLDLEQDAARNPQRSSKTVQLSRSTSSPLHPQSYVNMVGGRHCGQVRFFSRNSSTRILVNVVLCFLSNSFTIFVHFSSPSSGKISILSSAQAIFQQTVPSRRLVTQLLLLFLNLPP